MKDLLKRLATKAVSTSFIAGDTICQLSAQAHSKLTDKTVKQSKEELRLLSFMVQSNYMSMHKDVVVAKTPQAEVIYNATLEPVTL